jgi:hypothetical protein
LWILPVIVCLFWSLRSKGPCAFGSGERDVTCGSRGTADLKIFLSTRKSRGDLRRSIALRRRTEIASSSVCSRRPTSVCPGWIRPGPQMSSILASATQVFWYFRILKFFMKMRSSSKCFTLEYVLASFFGCCFSECDLPSSLLALPKSGFTDGPR